MNKFFKISLFSCTLLVGLFVFTACDKKEDTKPVTIVGKWKQTVGKDTYVLGGTTVTDDWFSEEDACDKDDITTFNEDKTYTITEGATKCATGDDDLVDAGSYTTNAQQTTLTIGGDTYQVTVTKTTLKLVTEETEDGIKYTITLEFQRQ